jgi:phosphonate transport system substrate-binding protein
MPLFGTLSRLLVVVAALAAAPAKAADPERSFAIVPQQLPSAAALRWQPLIDRVARDSGTTLRFATAASVAEFEARCLQGHYDYVFLNPLLFQEARRRVGYQALVRDSEPGRGVLVVHAEGPRRLEELNDQLLAFPASRAFLATLLTRAELRAAGIKHAAAYLGTHDSVVQGVLRRQYPAGGIARRSWDLLAPAQRQSLRVLHETRPVAPHFVAAHPRVPAGERARVQQTLLQLHAQPDGAALLTRVEWHRLQAFQESDLASLAGITLPPSPTTLDLHVIPRLDQRATQDTLEPLATFLRQRLDARVTLRAYPDMERFEAAVYQATAPALIIANPTQALRLAAQGFEIIAQERPVGSVEGMRGLILVRADSPYRTLADLAGKPIAFGGGDNAFFASIVPRAMLKREGLAGRYQDVSRPGPVAAVLEPLLSGEVEAVGIGSQAFTNQKIRERYALDRLRVLASSQAMPSLAWLAGPRLEPAMVEDLRQLVLRFGADAPGHAALRAAGIDHMQPADRRTYAGIAAYLAELKRP